MMLSRTSLLQLLAGATASAGIFAYRAGRPQLAKHAWAASWALLHLPGLFPNFPSGLPIKKQFFTTERKVWLTIDDGPSRNDTDRILHVLDEYNTKASFFVIGKEVERQRSLVRRMIDAGHSVENHSWSHRSGSLWMEPRALVREDVTRASHAIYCATGQSPRFFRAPAGRHSAALVNAASELQLTTVGWSASGGDGMCHGNLWKSMNRIVEKIRPGGIILIHQGGRRGRATALRYLLHRLEQEGWETTLPAPDSLE